MLSCYLRFSNNASNISHVIIWCFNLYLCLQYSITHSSMICTFPQCFWSLRFLTCNHTEIEDLCFKSNAKVTCEKLERETGKNKNRHQTFCMHSRANNCKYIHVCPTFFCNINDRNSTCRAL